MIHNFLSSWSLFHNAYLSGWLIAVLLSLLGILVIARDQIFIGAAISQASLLGIAAGMWIGSTVTFDLQSWWRSDIFYAGMGGLCAVLAALLTTGGGRRDDEESHEALTGWIFLSSASFSTLILSHSPHGREEAIRLLSSTIIGATRTDVWIFAILTAATAVALVKWYRPALLVVLDPEVAQAAGLRTKRWDTLFAVWLGVAVGFSIRVSGVVYTFAALILPPLIAKHLCREARSLFFLSPAIALLTGMGAFVLAHHYDFPPGQMAAACLSGVFAVTWSLHRLRAVLSRR
ncbi:MAG: metal ABC transporter permease [Candidatus Binatia bacterium]|nr:metal ABC transporter permease [Candidatus Binatia bacterium]